MEERKMKKALLTVLFLWIGGIAVLFSQVVRVAVLHFDPPVNQETIYSIYTNLDGSITRPQQYEGLIGFTRADFSVQITDNSYGALTSEVLFSNYTFSKQEITLGEGVPEGGRPGGAPPGGGGTAPGGPGGGGPGYSVGPGTPAKEESTDGIKQYPGPGGPGGPGGGGPAPGGEEVGGRKLDISELLKQKLIVVQNSRCEVLGSRGVELVRVKEEDVASQSLDQLMELFYTCYLPDKPVVLGESWFNTYYYTLLGVRKKLPIEMKFTVWPRFQIATLAGGLSPDEDVSAALRSPGRFFLARQLLNTRFDNQPGYTIYDLYNVVIFTMSGANHFDDSEVEETQTRRIERSFKGKISMGGVAVYDYEHSYFTLLSITQYVDYWKIEKEIPLQATLAEEEEPVKTRMLVNYRLDFDALLRAFEPAERELPSS